MTRSDLKTSRTGSRTPLQLLADYYLTGDTGDRDLWHDYSRVTRGLAAVRWSRGLPSIMIGLTTEHERTDAELAAGEVGGELLAVIPFPAWSRMRTADIEHAVLAAAECGGAAAVNVLFRQAQLPPADLGTGACPKALAALC